MEEGRIKGTDIVKRFLRTVSATRINKNDWDEKNTSISKHIVIGQIDGELWVYRIKENL